MSAFRVSRCYRKTPLSTKSFVPFGNFESQFGRCQIAGSHFSNTFYNILYSSLWLGHRQGVLAYNAQDLNCPCSPSYQWSTLLGSLVEAFGQLWLHPACFCAHAFSSCSYRISTCDALWLSSFKCYPTPEFNYNPQLFIGQLTDFINYIPIILRFNFILHYLDMIAEMDFQRLFLIYPLILLHRKC